MIFQPTYFSQIAQFQQMLKADEIVFEVHDNYLKQTYRTRLQIYDTNGLLNLTIPVQNIKGVKQKTKDTRIDNSEKWQQNHFRSLKNAYQSSPFYEFYEDDIIPLYEKPQKYLLDFLLKTQEVALEMLQIETKTLKSDEFKLDYATDFDYRLLANVKNNKAFIAKEYQQVFRIKHGFIPNLSILDLLFNEGPNAISFLQSN